MTRLCGIFAILAALILVLPGCQGDSGASSGNVLVIVRGNGGEPGSLDPALAEDIHAFNILTDLYEGLVSVGPGGEIVPGVAKSWSISDDGLEYTFRFRDDARWSDGAAVEPADFVRAYERITRPDSTSTYGFLLEPISELVVLDDERLQVRLSRPTPYLLSVLSMPIALPVRESSGETGGFADPDRFIGNGPYVLASHVVGTRIRLVRNPRYWDADSVMIDEVVYLPIADPDSELTMFRAGELHITQSIPRAQLQALHESLSGELRIAPALALYYLAFDLSEPPFDDRRLREALSLAIDREQLVELIGRGEQPAYGIVPPGVADYESATLSFRDLSKEERERRALDLYAEAGYTRDTPLEITYTYDAGGIHETIAVAVTSMWRQVLGVDASLDKREWQYFLETRSRRDEWQLMRFAWFGDYDHATTFTHIFRSGDPQNLPGYASPEYDRLLAADPESNAAEAALLADHPVAPLYFFVNKHLVDSRIAGYENNALDRHPSKYLSFGGIERPDH